MSIQYACKNEERRDLVKDHASLNGIDFLEVLDDDTLPIELRQCTLAVRLIRPLDGGITLEKENFRIDGGVRIRNIKIIDPPVLDGARETITLQVDRAGDFSTYTLRIFKDPEQLTYLDTFDPILSEVDFSFKVECPSEFDCKSEERCPPLTYPVPDINYLAKDYASFRRLMLDRLSLLMPRWKERNAADLQVALVELLAYKGDYLSYFQDAMGGEAYLGTARRRVSIRRHARLVDYPMHDGCNARAWVHLQLDAGSMTVEAQTQLLTHCVDASRIIDTDEAEKIIKQQKPEVFETMFAVTLRQAHNEMKFYTWGDNQCCLPKGAVKATLYEIPGMSLQKGDFLLFEEVKSPITEEPEDSDPTHRHVVRLVDVEDGIQDPLNNTSVVNIQWHKEDALPFPFCISTVIEEDGSEETVSDICIARGNMVLADHGQTITETDTFSVDQIENRLLEPLRLTEEPVTCTEGFDVNKEVSATSAMKRKLKKCRPAVVLIQDPEGEQLEWEAQKDLLGSKKFSKEFVVETESDGRVYVRFGDGILGQEPDPEKSFGARYRVGNGSDGNVGAGAIQHIIPQVGGITGITEVRNPLPARGGVDMETIEEARQFAPQAFRIPQRAVTEQDYADMAMRFPGIQKAVATFKWTGSWFTVFLVVDREQGKSVEKDEIFKEQLYQHMEKYRMAGFDLELDDPVYVPLDIQLKVCVKSGYFKSDVKEVLLQVFSNFEWEPGRLGFFHPDNFTFAQSVYLSRIYETAMKVEGVASVVVTKFERRGKGPDNEIEDGCLVPGRVEIVRLDNDPNYPENGKIEFEMQGGM